MKQLKDIVNSLKKNHKRVVLANGIFDILHVGHIRYLKEAKKFGDVLIVAVNSDSSTKRLKGDRRPILDENSRVYIVSKIKYVDYVFLFDDLNVENVLEILHPDIHVKGGDYTVNTIPEREKALKLGIKQLISGGEKVKSTTDIIRKIKERFG